MWKSGETFLEIFNKLMACREDYFECGSCERTWHEMHRSTYCSQCDVYLCFRCEEVIKDMEAPLCRHCAKMDISLFRKDISYHRKTDTTRN